MSIVSLHLTQNATHNSSPTASDQNKALSFLESPDALWMEQRKWFLDHLAGQCIHVNNLGSHQPQENTCMLYSFSLVFALTKCK